MRNRKITISSSVTPLTYNLLTSAAALNMCSVSAEIADRLASTFDKAPETGPLGFTPSPAANTPGKRAIEFLKAKHPRIYSTLQNSGRYELQQYVDGLL